MACDGCTDVCNCLVTAGTDIEVTGSGSVADPYIVTNTFEETPWEGTSPEDTITITPGGVNGHAPELDVNSCALYDTDTVETSGQLFVQSEDEDCIPHRLVAPAPGQILGETGGQWGPIDNIPASPPIGTDVILVYSNPALSPEVFEKADYPGMRGIFIEMVAGGGGGGGADGQGAGTAAVGAGGGGGGYSRVWVPTADLGISESVTVGAGGVGAAAGNNVGGVGGFSQFGTAPVFASAAPGAGGSGMLGASTTGSVEGGAGGAASSGTIYSTNGVKVTGGRGQRGQRLSGGENIATNGGGGSFFAEGAPARQADGNGINSPASAYGGGGGGGANAATSSNHGGGDGSPGVVIVTVVY